MSHVRLKRGVLTLTDVLVSSLANMGPALSLFFSMAFLVETMGKAVPFEVILAGIAILTLGNTMAQFSKSIPSAGSFITFISRTFGVRVGTTCAVTITVGYVIAIAGVMAALGGWVSTLLERDFGVHVPWLLIVVIGNLFITGLLLKGAKVSSFWAIVLFVLEAVALLLLSAAIFIRGGKEGLSLSPFSPVDVSWSALAAGFPLVIFMFVGWENSGALAEETADPRKNVPKAIFSGILLISALYLLCTYAAIEGFGIHYLDQMAKDEAPFDTLGRMYLGPLRVLIDVAGLTSIMATILAAGNSQTRILFHTGREGLLPAVLGKVNRRYQTPHVAIITYMALSTLMVLILGMYFDPNTCFGYLSTLGTIPLMIMYALSNLALPVYYKRTHPEQFGFIRHGIVPMVGLAILIWPFWELIQPNQPWPMNLFPWFIALVLVGGFLWTIVRLKKDPDLVHRAGTILADSDD